DRPHHRARPGRRRARARLLPPLDERCHGHARELRRREARAPRVLPRRLHQHLHRRAVRLQRGLRPVRGPRRRGAADLGGLGGRAGGVQAQVRHEGRPAERLQARGLARVRRALEGRLLRQPRLLPRRSRGRRAVGPRRGQPRAATRQPRDPRADREARL
ncbi:MAG: hypothetical protein AVDCRST_MAG38-2912, partial [uncultured Solirubrobacteraceae bacterium]